jgi:hypothetical protein
MSEETQYPLTVQEKLRGRNAYARYCLVVGTTWDGRELPQWEGLTDKIRKGWSEAGDVSPLLKTVGKLKEALLRQLLSDKTKLDEVALYISIPLSHSSQFTRRALAQAIKEDSPLAIELMTQMLIQTATSLHPPKA